MKTIRSLVHSRLLRASAAAALAVVILALGYLGTRGQPPTRNFPADQHQTPIHENSQ